LNSPTRPQLRPPTIRRMRVIRFKGFIAFSMLVAAGFAAD
jgi:hypothetical protein